MLCTKRLVHCITKTICCRLMLDGLRGVGDNRPPEQAVTYSSIDLLTPVH